MGILGQNYCQFSCEDLIPMHITRSQCDSLTWAHTCGSDAPAGFTVDSTFINLCPYQCAESRFLFLLTYTSRDIHVHKSISQSVQENA